MCQKTSGMTHTKRKDNEMEDIISTEIAAHYIRGFTTMYFIALAMVTAKYRHRDRMRYWLFVAASFIAVNFLKDIVFVVNPWKNNVYVQDLVAIFDSLCTPFVCAYFYEASRPGAVTFRRFLLSLFPFLMFFPAYMLFPCEAVVVASCVFSALFVVVSLVLVAVNVSRYSKSLADNYSYSKGIGVKWVVTCALAYFISFFLYILCFMDTTWLGEIVFDLGSIPVWTSLCVISYRHHVVVLQQDDDTEEASVETVDPDKSLESMMNKCMEQDRMYLIPRLTLGDLSIAAGKNRTYVSNFINQKGMTFCDYVNGYRIEEACRIIDSLSHGERVTVAEVATRSGFNSISSFNRYFRKVKGVTPSQYISLHS